MSNTADESPDTLHLLCLQKLFVESLPLRDRANQLFGLLGNMFLHLGIEPLQLVLRALAIRDIAGHRGETDQIFFIVPDGGVNHIGPKA